MSEPTDDVDRDETVLRDLIAYWRQRVEDNERKGSDAHKAIAIGRRRSADELEAFLDG